MTYAIDNTLTSEELSKDLSLFAEMPATNVPTDHHNLKQAGEAVLVVVGAGAILYVGNKAIDYFKNNMNNVSTVDPNKDIAWEYQDN